MEKKESNDWKGRIKDFLLPSVMLTSIIFIRMYVSGTFAVILTGFGVENTLTEGMSEGTLTVWLLMLLEFLTAVAYSYVHNIRLKREEKEEGFINLGETLGIGFYFVLISFLVKMMVVFVSAGAMMVIVVVLNAIGIGSAWVEIVALVIQLGITLGVIFIGKGVLAYLTNRVGEDKKVRNSLRFVWDNLYEIMKIEIRYFLREIWGVLLFGIGYVFTKARALRYKSEEWEELVNKEENNIE